MEIEEREKDEVVAARAKEKAKRVTGIRRGTCRTASASGIVEFVEVQSYCQTSPARAVDQREHIAPWESWGTEDWCAGGYVTVVRSSIVGELYIILPPKQHRLLFTNISFLCPKPESPS